VDRAQTYDNSHRSFEPASFQGPKIEESNDEKSPTQLLAGDFLPRTTFP